MLRPKLSTVPDETSPVRDCGRIHACATVIIAIRRHCPTGLVPYNCWCWLESVCGLHWPATGSRRRTEPSASRKIAFLSDGVNLRVNCGRIVRRNRQCSGQGVSIGGATTVIWDCTVRFRHWWRCASRTTQCFTHGWPVLHFAYNFVSCVVRTRWGFFFLKHAPARTNVRTSATVLWRRKGWHTTDCQTIVVVIVIRQSGVERHSMFYSVTDARAGRVCALKYAGWDRFFGTNWKRCSTDNSIILKKIWRNRHSLIMSCAYFEAAN